MATAAPTRISKRKKTSEPEYKFGINSNGILMSPEEFDAADPDDFDECWDYELINGLLIVLQIPREPEADANEQLGCWLRTYRDDHQAGCVLDATLGRQYMYVGNNRRLADRVIWLGLGRLPRKKESPTIVADFVSKRKCERVRDYETKREEYRSVGVREYWIIDRFERTMTVHILEDGEYRKKVLHANRTYRARLLPGFELPLARLFDLADEWDDEARQGLQLVSTKRR